MGRDTPKERLRIENRVPKFSFLSLLGSLFLTLLGSLFVSPLSSLDVFLFGLLLVGLGLALRSFAR
jgi:hypothetical protein